jgi:hypothetical protein
MSAPNIKYVQGDVLGLSSQAPSFGTQFSKILMNGGMQYFKNSQIDQIANIIAVNLQPSGLALLTAIPDRRRRFKFYNTPARRVRMWWNRVIQSDPMGTWWVPEEIARAADKAGMESEVIEHEHYRFTIKLAKRS